MSLDGCSPRARVSRLLSVNREIDTFNDKQSQIAERKTGDGRGPGDHRQRWGGAEVRVRVRVRACFGEVLALVRLLLVPASSAAPG